jgi:hypothetical protein
LELFSNGLRFGNVIGCQQTFGEERENWHGGLGRRIEVALCSIFLEFVGAPESP